MANLTERPIPRAGRSDQVVRSAAALDRLDVRSS